MRAGSLCLHEIFEDRVREAPDRPAVTFEGETLSYGELNRRANQLAHFLRDQGVGRESLVGLCLDRSLDTVIAILAVLKAGGAYVPMDPANPAERVRMIVEDAQCEIILIHEAQYYRFQDKVDTSAVALDGLHSPWVSFPEDNPTSLTDSDALVYVMYTSGSTGRPKGVPITHRNVARLFTSITHWFDFCRDDVWPLFHSFAFDLSVWEIWGALLHGGRIVVVPYWVSRSPAEFYKLLVEEKITQLCQTPSALRQLQTFEDTLKRNEWKQLVLRYIVLGGEALSFPGLASWFERHGDEYPQIVNMYGITETTIHVTYRRVRAHEAVPGTPSYIGVPIPDQPCHVVNGDGRLAAIGEEGELYVGGAGNARGYFNRPELSAERFVPSPFPEDIGAMLYKSGDLVRRLDGDMIYLGRIDKQVQLRGFRVELGEIETQLLTCDGIHGAAVSAHASGHDDLRLVAYYVAQAALPAQDIRDHLSRLLPEYMIPSLFMRIDSMPLTGNGKTDYRALPAPVFEREGAAYVAPENGIEIKLAAIWQELLQIPEVGVEDNFFALGGHSLLATRLLFRVEEEFGARLPLRAFHQAPTIAGLSTLMSTTPTTAQNRALELKRLERTGPLRLSYAQERLWFLGQLDRDNCAYVIPILFEIVGKIDVTRLREALSAIVSRHEILRTRFERIDGTLVQLVEPSSDATIHCVPVESIEHGANVADSVRCALSRAAGVSLDLECGPLFKFIYYTHQEDHSFLGLLIHHAIFDGWSISVFLNDLNTAYTRLGCGEHPVLPPLAIQYGDFGVWQRSQYDAGNLEHDLEYWKHQLASPLPLLELPTDYTRPPRLTWQGAIARSEIGADRTTALEKLAITSQTTLFTVMIAAWQLLLHRYSGHNDIVVGCAIAGRTHPATEAMIGFFVNTVAIRTRLSKDWSFLDLLREANTLVLEAQEHQELPFDRVVAEVRDEQDPSRSPVFQVMFVLHNTPNYETSFSDLTVVGEELGNGCAKFDLSIAVQPANGALRLSLEYNTSLFRASTAERMLRSYETLLASIVAHPEGRLDALQIVAGPERTLLLETWTDTAFPLDRTQSLHQRFEARAAEAPDAVAVADDDTSLTYGALDARANQLAHYLLSEGVALEEPVPFFLSRSVLAVVAALGIVKAGAAYVPLDLLDPPVRRARVLGVLKPRLLLTESALRESLGDETLPLRCLDDPDLLKDHSTVSPAIDRSGPDLAYVIFTSGSTGEPKGVCCTHQGVINLYQDLQARCPVGPGDACSLWTALSFDVSVYESWTSLLAGATLHLIPERVRTNSALCLDWLGTRGVVTGYIPGFMLPALLERQRRTPLPLKRLLVGVEPLSEALLCDIMEATPDLVLLNLYGPTEAAIYVTLYQVDDTWPRPTGNAPIGTAIQNTRIHVLDPAMNPVPVGVPGELYIGGVGLARGYYNAPELTAQQFVPDPFSELDTRRLYRTGDLVYFKEDGNIQFLRRMDRYIKLRGYRIEPGEIESCLRAFPGVDDAVVLLYDKGDTGPGLVAYLAAQYPESIDRDALTEFLRTRLPAHMCPARFMTMPAFPRTVQGKLDRKALPEPVDYTDTQHGESPGPRNECERLILDLWRECLGTEFRSIHSDFFTLGGHSLLAVRMLDSVNRRLGAALTLSDFFADPTVAGLAARFGKDSKTTVPDRGIKLREVKSGDRNPLFCLPGAGDSSGSYDAFAEALSADQSFFGFSNIESATGEPVSVQQLAKQCIDEMKKIRPKGPYYLGGFSFGGTLAYEMARQLIESGEQVPFLAVIDGSAPDYFPDRATFSMPYLRCFVERSRARINFFARTWKLQLGYLRDGFQLFLGAARWHRDPDQTPPRLSEYLRWVWVDTSLQYYFIQAGLSTPTIGDRRVDLFLDQVARARTSTMRASRHTAARYSIEPVPVTLTLFRAQHNPYKSERRDPTYGWKRYALGGVRIVEIPGNHMAIMRPPYATGLGQALQRIMDELESQNAAP